MCLHLKCKQTKSNVNKQIENIHSIENQNKQTEFCKQGENLDENPKIGELVSLPMVSLFPDIKACNS